MLSGWLTIFGHLSMYVEMSLIEMANDLPNGRRFLVKPPAVPPNELRGRGSEAEGACPSDIRVG
jgi:hypothetical protein